VFFDLKDFYQGGAPSSMTLSYRLVEMFEPSQPHGACCNYLRDPWIAMCRLDPYARLIANDKWLSKVFLGRSNLESPAVRPGCDPDANRAPWRTYGQAAASGSALKRLATAR
jgi:hypothetical protein